MSALRKFIHITFKTILILFVILAVWSIFIEPNWIITRQETLFIPHWDAKLDGMKVAMIADPHVGTINSKLDKLQQVVEMVNKEKPDLIALLGDFDTNTIEKANIDRKKMAKILSQLSAPCGVVAVLGNHDFKNDKIIIKILKKADIKILRDSKVKLKYNDTRFYVAGLQDYWHYKLKIDKALKSIPDDASIILLSHNPDVFPQVPPEVSLTLAGHTHGGVIILPFLGSLFSPSDYYQRYLKGYIVENNKHLYVSSGYAGAPPIRLNNPPEVVILTLRSQQFTNNPIINTPVREGINKSFIPHYFHLKYKVLEKFSDLFKKQK